MQFRKKHYKNELSGKNQSNKQQNLAKQSLDRQIAEISLLSSGNIIRYKFLSSKDVLNEKDVLEKAAAIKRFQYSQLGN